MIINSCILRRRIRVLLISCFNWAIGIIARSFVLDDAQHLEGPGWIAVSPHVHAVYDLSRVAVPLDHGISSLPRLEVGACATSERERKPRTIRT
jgi:hypothetical protein